MTVIPGMAKFLRGSKTPAFLIWIKDQGMPSSDGLLISRTLALFYIYSDLFNMSFKKYHCMNVKLLICTFIYKYS